MKSEFEAMVDNLWFEARTIFHDESTDAA